ncbi:MAG: thioredoxin family protein [Pyrinomonadaceae bacterium]|nr:thioredoxin family protein [Pyrinomonadaceae bacterium]MBP6213809.1 thioredoxin family protein [Pyrinomonadaceae bacterium]
MREFVERTKTYSEYLAMVDGLLAEGKTTGPVQSEEKTRFTALNRQRMKRLEKTFMPDNAANEAVAALNVDWIWLVITEGWCGDAAQNLPVIEKIAAANDGIRTRYVLRDENLELMDQFLTNGARSIPVLIGVDAKSYKVLGSWHSRPAKGQEYFLDLKAQGLTKPEIDEKMQRWYNEDKGRSLQAEFVELTSNWYSGGAQISVAAGTK